MAVIKSPARREASPISAFYRRKPPIVWSFGGFDHCTAPPPPSVAVPPSLSSLPGHRHRPNRKKNKKKRENIQGERGRIAAVSEGGRRPGVAAGAHPPGARCRCRWRAPPWAGSRRRGRLLGVGSVPFSLVRNPSSALIGWGCSVYSGSLFFPPPRGSNKNPTFSPPFLPLIPRIPLLRGGSLIMRMLTGLWFHWVLICHRAP